MGLPSLPLSKREDYWRFKDGGLAFAVNQKAGGAIKASTRVMEVFGTKTVSVHFEIKNGIANNMLFESGSLRVEENDFAYKYYCR